MPKLTALVHARPDDADNLARLLQSLQSCDEVLVINHDGDNVDRIADEHGATTKAAVPGVAAGAYVTDAKNDWILSVMPSEMLSEQLQSSLLEWKNGDHDPRATFSIAVQEQSRHTQTRDTPSTRLVNRVTVNWISELPADEPGSHLLAGPLIKS